MIGFYTQHLSFEPPHIKGDQKKLTMGSKHGWDYVPLYNEPLSANTDHPSYTHRNMCNQPSSKIIPNPQSQTSIHVIIKPLPPTQSSLTNKNFLLTKLASSFNNP